MRQTWRGVALLAIMLCCPASLLAQDSAIAGVVKDPSGAVMPGVTVEASSPALIERVRTAVTDSQGQYKIVNLRPGTYTVTFSLTGFTTVKREGIELTAQFTAPVNAELRLGTIEETVVVAGVTPVVDTQNVVRRQVITKDVIDAMPTSKNWSTIGIMTVGVSSNQSDVGGSAGEHQNQLKAHGGSFNDRLVQLDGLMISNMACAYSCVGLSTNDASTQELSYEVGALSAENATGGGGVRVNIIPKEGGNRFSGSAFGNFSTHTLQASNLSRALFDQGVRSADTIDNIYDASFAIGGPVKRDTVWFWTAHRFWGYKIFRTDAFYEKTPGDFVYDPDLSQPAADSQPNTSDDLRLTWQMSPTNKVAAYYNIGPRKTNLWNLSRTTQADASQLQRVNPNYFYSLTYRSTLSNRMLVEAGFGNLTEDWTREPNPESSTSLMYPVTEQTTGVNFRAYNNVYSHNITSVRSYRTSLSYVTGSHAFKFGWNMQEGPSRRNLSTTYDTSLTVRNGNPFSVTVRTTPYVALERLVADLGLYAQDTWTVKRFTFNFGVRFDYLNNKVPAQDAPGGRWIGPRHFDELTDVPNWKDIGPRIGVAYDLFGNGRTAVKATLSRYVQTSTVGMARDLNPLETTVNNATRGWSDTNRDGIPQESELGPLSNQNFGKVNVATRFDPDTVTGWFKRRNNWEVSASITQEVTSRVAADVAYFRRAQGNFFALDNLNASPADYDPFCVIAPADPRLPNGGSYQICGLYDIRPAKFGSVNNFVTFADNFTGHTEVFNGIDTTVNARFSRDLFIQGGIASGNIHTNNCGAFPDYPATAIPLGNGRTGTTNIFAYCDTNTSWLTQVKVSGSFTLPWQDLQLGAVLQNLPGQQILAQWAITSATPGLQTSLGRALAEPSLTVPLIEPGTMYTPRRTQLDLRIGKTLTVTGSKRLQLMADIFNAFNSAAAVGATSQAGEPPAAINTTFGSDWLKPFNILQARYIKFGAQLNF